MGKQLNWQRPAFQLKGREHEPAIPNSTKNDAAARWLARHRRRLEPATLSSVGQHPRWHDFAKKQRAQS